VVVGVEYTPVAVDTDDDTVVDQNDACPEQSEDLDGFRDGDGCPDPDNDGDGISDEEDECPHEPEDPDGFEDSDGCPDPDNDGDGISDVRDVCPREAGAEKKDGCPFVDTDGDGISDARDECPEKPEDEDGFRDGDGCPDPDNDGDGIADEEDECPSEPETVNGVDDEDGCPDEGASGVEVSEGEIEIEDRVFFDTDRATIKQKSYIVLEEVASALEANAEIEKVRIEGHTDADGRDLYNLALSQRRSNAVREFLVDRGVDPSRLESKGYGEAEPIASNDTEEGRRKNRRVEMTILEVEE
jgi:outer membrane protein OmpA-like peptidoglycan-associated protein